MKHLATVLDKYIKDKHTQEECVGFIDGYEQGKKYLNTKSLYGRIRVSYLKFYYKHVLREAKHRFKDKPSTLKLTRRFVRYKVYLLNK